jgi:hypothetical protein
VINFESLKHTLNVPEGPNLQQLISLEVDGSQESTLSNLKISEQRELVPNKFNGQVG